VFAGGRCVATPAGLSRPRSVTGLALAKVSLNSEFVVAGEEDFGELLKCGQRLQ
jgi:hypothetical protein